MSTGESYIYIYYIYTIYCIYIYHLYIPLARAGNGGAIKFCALMCGAIVQTDVDKNSFQPGGRSFSSAPRFAPARLCNEALWRPLWTPACALTTPDMTSAPVGLGLLVALPASHSSCCVFYPCWRCQHRGSWLVLLLPALVVPASALYFNIFDTDHYF